MSDAFAERLRRLRRDGGTTTSAPVTSEPVTSEPAELEPPGSTEGGLPNWFRERARRRPESALPDEARSLEPPTDLDVEQTAAGTFASRTRTWAADHRHGTWRLGEVAAALPDALALLGRDPRLAELDLTRAVYLDIETTGLSGGAGTVPFLVGLGRFEDGRFELWQGFVRDPSEEAAMLSAAAQRVATADGVVSFFGKVFDRHRLEDKMRVFGIAPPFADRPHLDLYHPCQRLYASALADGRLQTMERALLDLVREDDLPGAFAPAAWFDFLAGRAHRLEDVFRHNELDVLSLAALAAHVGRATCEDRPCGSPYDGPEAERAAGIAALLAGERRREEALDWIERALARRRPAARAWLRLRASCLQGLKRTDDAIAAWRAVAEDATDAWSVEAWIQVAKLEEHARRDPAAALCALESAEALLERVPPSATRARDVDARRRRLECKLGRS